MSLSVGERARRIAAFRFVEVRLMEMAAAWTPTTPELEVKVLLGRHVWDFAQHADALGKRTFELRQPAQHSQRPVEPYVQLLDDVAAVTGTAERLGALYDTVLAGLERRYLRYGEETDAILDAPSLVILERIRLDLRRERQEADEVRRELGLPVLPCMPLRQRESALGEIVAAPGP